MLRDLPQKNTWDGNLAKYAMFAAPPIYSLFTLGLYGFLLGTAVFTFLFMAVISWDAYVTRDAMTRQRPNDLLQDGLLSLFLGVQLLGIGAAFFGLFRILLRKAYPAVGSATVWNIGSGSISFTDAFPYLIGLSVLVIGFLGFMVRKRQRFVWGATEVVVGISLPAIKAWGLPPSLTAFNTEFVMFLITAGVYLVVRGFDNIDQAKKSA